MLTVDEMLEAVDTEQKRIDDEKRRCDAEYSVLHHRLSKLQDEFVQRFKKYAELYGKLRRLGYKHDEDMKIFYLDDERNFLHLYWVNDILFVALADKYKLNDFPIPAWVELGHFYTDGSAMSCEHILVFEWAIAQLENHMSDILSAVNKNFSNIVEKIK